MIVKLIFCKNAIDILQKNTAVHFLIYKLLSSSCERVALQCLSTVV